MLWIFIILDPILYLESTIQKYTSIASYVWKLTVPLMVKLYSGHSKIDHIFLVHFQIDEERMANLDKNGRTDSNAGCNGCLPPSASNVEVRLPMGEDEPGMTMMNSNLYMSSSDMRHNNQQRTAVRIDEVCRFVFPLGFIIFNVCYWNYYNTPEVAEDWVFLIFLRFR